MYLSTLVHSRSASPRNGCPQDASRFVCRPCVQLRPCSDFPAISSSAVKWSYPLKSVSRALSLAWSRRATARPSRSEAAAATTSLAPAHRPSTTRPSEVCDCDCVLVSAPAAALRYATRTPPRGWYYQLAKSPAVGSSENIVIFPQFQCYGCSVTSNASGLFRVRRGWMSFAMLVALCQGTARAGLASRSVRGSPSSNFPRVTLTQILHISLEACRANFSSDIRQLFTTSFPCFGHVLIILYQIQQLFCSIFNVVHSQLTPESQLTPM